MKNHYNINKPRLTRGEYWLLESVVNHAIRLNLLNYEDLGQALNKKAHGMDRRLLIETMFELLNNGLIELYKWDVVKHTKETLKPNRVNIIQGIDEKRNFDRTTKTIYQLTKLGGQVWEAFAQPDWGLFLDEWSVTNKTQEEYVVVCANERLLKNYFASRNDKYMTVDMETINWIALEQYNATYWKTLPIGYRVDFIYTDVEDRDENVLPYRHVYPFHMPYPKWYFWK